jgi:acyl dehydratase
MNPVEFKDLPGLVGQETGVSDWLEITQERVNQFAEATGDHQWIHVDPERAADGPFGTTIAHGYLTLAMLPQLMQQIYRLENVKLAINYGLNKVRFPAPVPVGSKIRAETAVVEVADVGGGAHQVTLTTTVSIDGSTKPACVAESVVRYLL